MKTTTITKIRRKLIRKSEYGCNMIIKTKELNDIENKKGIFIERRFNFMGYSVCRIFASPWFINKPTMLIDDRNKLK